VRSNVAREGFYAVWLTGMGHIVGMALQRLVVFPGLFRLLGAARFGPFVLAYSIVSVLSYAPIASLNLSYYRQQQRLNGRGFASLAGAAFLLGITVASGLGLAFVILTPFWGWVFTNPEVDAFVPGMAIVLGAMGIMWTLDSQLMLRGEFAQRAFLQALFGVLAIGAVGLAWIDSVWGVSAGLVMASLGASVLAFRRLWRTGAIVVERGSVLAAWKALLPGAGVYLVNTLSQMSVQYADRLVLGMYASGEIVSFYFAASTVAVLCCMPFSLVSSVLVPLMSSGRISIVDRAGALRYFGAIGLGALVTVLFGLVVGPGVLGILYGGEVAQVNQVVFPVLLAGQAVYLLQQFSRPFLPLYFPFALQILIDVVTTTCLIGLLLWAAPTAGVMGVAAVAASGAAAFGFAYAGASVALADRAAEAAVRTRRLESGRIATHGRTSGGSL
jgi:O-antigen/teichoic acid export membrane protein